MILVDEDRYNCSNRVARLPRTYVGLSMYNIEYLSTLKS